MKRHLVVLALCAFFVPAAVLAGCGGVPGNAVAEVDGTAIEKTNFEHWMTVAAKSSGQPSVPKPPDYAACVANARKNLPKPGKGQPKTTDKQLQDQCRQQYNQLRDQVVGLLISFEWIDREAEEQGIKVSDAEVKKSFDQQRKASFPKDDAYKKFLEDSGYVEADILQRIRADLLFKKLSEKATKGKDKVTDEQVKAFYDKNKARFAQPERRDLSVVLTKTEAKARAARRALEGGQSFKQVAKRFSIDDTSKAQGGKLPGVARGQQEKAFDDAIFKAPKGKLTGPVKTQFGWYVFRVDKVIPASQQSLAEAKPVIEAQLGQENQQKAQQRFVDDLRKRWREKTECREGFVTTECKNGPKPTPTPAPGQAPSQSQR